jgi:hypothetical protein
MVADVDPTGIWRAAQIVMDVYGDEAELAAAQWANQAINQCDMDGRNAWGDIAKAIACLRRAEPSLGSVPN